jgi:hypothetical protein
MGRSSAFWWRLGLAVALWSAVIGGVQAVVGAEIGRAARELEEKIEQRVRGIAAPDPPGEGGKSPERSHDDESLQPWELVSV